MINENTRIDAESQSCIDLIFINKFDNTSGFGTMDIHISDHKPIFICRKINYFQKSIKSVNNIIKYKDWKNYNNTSVLNDISELNLSFNFQQENINIIFSEYFDCLLNIENKHIIEKRKRVRTRIDTKWFNSEILSAMNRRDNVKKKFTNLKKNGITDQSVFNEYKILRNKVLCLIRKARNTYYSSLIDKCNKDGNNIWKIIKEVISTKKSRNNMRDENNKITANVLNTHF